MKEILELRDKKIQPLFWQYALPSVAGTLTLAIYYIIDSVFIGYGPGLGDHALGALGILLPIMNLLAALGTLIGVGTSSRISIYLGLDNKEMVVRVMGTSLLFTFIISIIPVIITYVFMEPILYWMGATEETYQFAEDFLVCFLPASLLLNMGTTFINIVKAIGFPKKSMYIMASSVVFNFILAPLFIFVFKWGMKGAGGATLLSTILSACIIIPYFSRESSFFPVKMQNLRLRAKILYQIVNIGFAPFLITAMTSLIVFFTNTQLIAYSTPVSLEGYIVASRFHYVFIMIFIGISQGIQPIIGYNFGAQNYTRMFQTLYYAFKVAFGIGVVALLLGIFASKEMVQIFNPNPELIEEASKALFVLTVTLPLAGCQLLMGGFFQHIGIAIKSAALSVIRQAFFIPLIYLLPLYWGVNGVWASLPLSEILVCLLTYIIFYFQKKQMDGNK
ncbi:MAG: MATE family efflux transporter [Tannerellaceae bacterium]|jgi:putative MATE family efflux protein|nr:MATE family efflux transporter [Tannerellaceae bacterium]